MRGRAFEALSYTFGAFSIVVFLGGVSFGLFGYYWTLAGFFPDMVFLCSFLHFFFMSLLFMSLFSLFVLLYSGVVFLMCVVICWKQLGFASSILWMWWASSVSCGSRMLMLFGLMWACPFSVVIVQVSVGAPCMCGFGWWAVMIMAAVVPVPSMCVVCPSSLRQAAIAFSSVSFSLSGLWYWLFILCLSSF